MYFNIQSDDTFLTKTKTKHNGHEVKKNKRTPQTMGQVEPQGKYF